MILALHRNKDLNCRGFTLIETLMVIALIGILSVVTFDVITDTLTESRFDETVAKMNQIKSAMLGNPDIREVSTRTSFGFLGDLGAIPTLAQGISALVTNPGLPVYAISASGRFGLGWNGPYLTGSGSGVDYTTDAWGTAFVYSPTASPPTLVSYGADKVAGGTGFNQDITVTMPTEMTTATVSGFICQSGAPFANAAEVQLNYPNGLGVRTQPTQVLAPADNGQFSFSSIPYGVRSVTIYRPSKAGATSTLGPIVFTVDKPNFIIPCDRIDINN